MRCRAISDCARLRLSLIHIYALDTNSYLLYQKGVATMLAYTDPATKVLQTVVPIRNDYFELPMQQLAGVCGFWTYYMYTGDAEFIKEVYPYAKDYVGLWTLGSDGLVVHRGGSWDWADWGSDFGMPTLENAWYYKALQLSLIHIFNPHRKQILKIFIFLSIINTMMADVKTKERENTKRGKGRAFVNRAAVSSREFFSISV